MSSKILRAVARIRRWASAQTETRLPQPWKKLVYVVITLKVLYWTGKLVLLAQGLAVPF